MPTIREKLDPLPRLQNSLVPTPVHRLDHLSAEYGVNVYCKRDDLTGFGFGGNKTRKLDFLLAHALARRCDTLIAIGANQSNFCRVAATYGVASGMEVHLVLGGRQPEILLHDPIDGRVYTADRTSATVSILLDSGTGIAEVSKRTAVRVVAPIFVARDALLAELENDPGLHLFDASGRRVLNPRPGVLFVRSAASVRRVLIAD